jgi:hypothetical protein
MAEKLARYGLTQRTALLLVLLAVLSVSGILLTPKKAEAACCNFDTVRFYYFDAAKTQYAGQCWTNECTNSSGCSGTTPTAYKTVSRVCCEICQS